MGARPAPIEIGASPMDTEPFELRSVLLGPLPIINHFCGRLGLRRLLAEYLPDQDARVRYVCARSCPSVVLP